MKVTKATITDFKWETEEIEATWKWIELSHKYSTATQIVIEWVKTKILLLKWVSWNFTASLINK